MAKMLHGLGWLALAVLCLVVTGCQRTEVKGSSTTQKSSPAAKRTSTAKAPVAGKGVDMSTPARAKADQRGAASSAKTASTPKRNPLEPNIDLSPNHDDELRRIIDLARQNKWEEAEKRAAALHALDPKDPAVERIYNWVKTEGPKRREKILEDTIRDVNSQETRFEPSVKSLLGDKKSQGLPPRTELRDAIDALKAQPYIPESYGKTIQARGTLEDFQSDRGRMAVLLDKNIEVHLDNVALENIIFNVGQAEGINFVADRSLPAFQQKLSVNMKNVKLAEFLHYVSRNLGVSFQVGGDLIWITDAKNTNTVYRETRFYRLRRGFVMPAQFGISDTLKRTVVANNVTTVTEQQKFENFVRDGAPMEPSIETAIKNFFTGEYLVDYERNLIVARGNHEQLEVMERIIREFDKPLQQVLIEARFITVSEAAFLKLGVIWESNRDPLAPGRSPTDYTGLAPGEVGLGLENTWYGILGSDSLSATITAIEQSGESEMLSAPRVTLINNLPATISDGKVQYYYEEYKVSQKINQDRSSSSLVPSGKPVSIIAGVSLDVLASIGVDGRSIYLALNPEVSQDVQLVPFATVTDRNDQGKVTSTFDIRLPEARRQSLATRVMIKSGQTVVMGGVLQREQKTFVEAVPVLSRIPIIGAAFRRREEVDRPRYLLVFVTASLLSESGQYLESAKTE